MKVWDNNLRKYVDNTAQHTPKQAPSAYYPWNEALAKKTEGETTHYEPVTEKTEQAAAFEYSIEIACTQTELNTYQVGEFSLWKTKDEAAGLSWVHTQTKKGFTLLTTSIRVDEPKTLVRELFASSGGALIFQDVNPVKAGSGSYAESFIPVKPAVQVGERLGWPTEGYFYYFMDDTFIHEYKLLGEGKSAFQVTLSDAGSLTDELLSEHTYRFMLVPWKINHATVARQHLLYLPQKMTLEQLEAVTPTWLDDNACLLDVDSIVKTKEDKNHPREQQDDNQTTYTIQSGDTLSDIAAYQGLTLEQLVALNPVYQDNVDSVLVGDTLIIETKDTQATGSYHTVKTSPDTGEDETWSEIAAQHGLAARALLDINPMYEQDPFSLKVGDVLFVRQANNQAQPEKRSTLPPQNVDGIGQTIRFSNAYTSQIKDRMLNHNVVAALQGDAIPLSTPIINIHKVNADVVNSETLSGPIKFSIGFTQVTKTQTLEDCWGELFCNNTLDSTKERVMNLNSHLNNPVRAGEIIIFTTSEPENDDERAELETIITDASLASKGLAELTDEQAELHDNYFEVFAAKFLEYLDKGTPADGFAIMGAGVGSVASGMQRHLEGVTSNISKLDKLYLAYLSKSINKKGFIEQRQILTGTLNKSLDNLTKKTLNIPTDLKLKDSLGLGSTKSLVHNASEMSNKGSVGSLGAITANTAKWLKRMEGLGNVAIGLNIVSGVYNVATTCTGLESCGRETAKQTGGVVGGWGGGALGAFVGSAILVSLSIASAPVVLVVVGAGALGGGIFGAGAGQDFGENVYEYFKLDEFLTNVENKIIEDIPQEIEEYILNERFRGFAIPRGFK